MNFDFVDIDCPVAPNLANSYISRGCFQAVNETYIIPYAWTEPVLMGIVTVLVFVPEYLMWELKAIIDKQNKVGPEGEEEEEEKVRIGKEKRSRENDEDEEDEDESGENDRENFYVEDIDDQSEKQQNGKKKRKKKRKPRESANSEDLA